MNDKSLEEPDAESGTKAEKTLGRSEPIFRLLVGAVIDYAIYALDTNGHVLTWNRGAQRIHGYVASEIIGQHFSRFYTPQDIASQHPQNELKVAAESGKYEEEGWRVKKDGTRFWAGIVINKLVDENGRFVGFVKLVRDLTERKIVETRLRESEERFRLMIESVKDYAIFMLDPNGNVATWNEGARRIKQYRASEIIGQHFSKFYPWEEIENGKPDHELKVATLTGRFEDEGWRLKKDGTRFWANVVITAMQDKEGRLIGFSKVTRDLTERKRNEENLRRANENLEKRVTERTEDLVRLTHRLETAINTRNNFLSIASHELKTPLTSLKLQAELRVRELTRNNPAPIPQNFFEEMAKTDVKQIDRLARLVNDMSDITCIAAGKFRITRRRFDLVTMIQETLERMKFELEAKGCRVSFNPSGPITGEWDAYRLEQVLTNLLTNAVKYGEGTPIEIDVMTNATVAQFSVQDHGRGVAPENHEKIFQQFERASPSFEMTGLGLGLYIVRKIVEAQNGRVWVESELGRGARFTVELPLTP